MTKEENNVSVLPNFGPDKQKEFKKQRGKNTETFKSHKLQCQSTIINDVRTLACYDDPSFLPIAIFRKQRLPANDNRGLLILLSQIYQSSILSAIGSSQNPVPRPESPSPDTKKSEPG